MKSSMKAPLIIVAVVLAGFASLTLASETLPMKSDYETDCVVEERSDCAERCLTENNCCIKSCNWVEPKAKSACIKHCKSVLKKCHLKCDEKPAAD